MKSLNVNTLQIVFFMCFLFCSLKSVAGGGHVVGNGGYVLECHSNGTNKWVSYDLEEGLILNQLTPKYSSFKSYTEKARDVINRIHNINPFRAKLYKHWLFTFEAESQFLKTDTYLVDIPDISFGVVPKNCYLHQAIVQIASPSIGEARYFINSTIWQRLDENQKAALVIHELIYREAISEENRHQNSVQVRKLNQWLHSGKLESMTVQKYIELIRQLQFAQVDAHQIPILLFAFKAKSDERIEYPVHFWNSQSVKSAQVYFVSDLKFPSIQVKYKCPANVYQLTTMEGRVEFYTSNKVKTLSMPVFASESSSESCYGGLVNLNAFGFNGMLKANKFEFSELGTLVSAVASDGFNGSILDFALNGKRFQVNAHLSTGKVFEFLPYRGIYFSEAFCNPYNPVLDVYIDGGLSSKNILKVSKNSSAESVEIQYCP